MISKSARSPIGRTLFCGASAIAALAAASAQAQTSDTAAASAPSAPAQNGEILVTASRREESAKNVPVAVTAIGGEKLAVLNSSGLDIRFLSSRTPSLQIESSFGRTFPRFYIRGLGNTDFDPNAAQPVSIVYDDVALESNFLKSFPVFDLQNVEVLRGPQGTLFGRNTPAGVIKLDSQKPTDHFGGYLTGSLATYKTANVEGAVGGPIADGLDWRASGILQRRDNWVTNDSDTGSAPKHLEGYRDLAGRFQLGYTSGDFHALWNIHGRDLNGSPRLFRAGLFTPGSNHFQPGFDKDHVSQDGVSEQDMSQWGTNLHLDYKFEGIGTLYSITAYETAHVKSVGDIDGGNAYPFPTGIGNPIASPPALNAGAFPDNTGDIVRPHEFSQEVRFASEDFGGFRAQGGVYYFHQRLNYHELDFDATGTQDGDVYHSDKNENYGIFASGEYKATDKLTLRAGVRYSHDSKRDFVTGSTPGITDTLTLPMSTPAHGSDVTWDASATYALTPQLNVYARVATGYLGPAIQDRVTFGSVPSVAKKQTTISGEGGFKFESRDRRFHVDLDGYWWRTKNLQLTAVGGQSNSAALINADHAVGYGIEGQVDARPIPNLTLTAGGSWNFTEIRDPNISVGVCGAACTVTDPLDAAGRAIIDGNDLPQAPRYVFNVTARYGIPLKNGGEIFAYTDWAYRSKINYFLYTAKEFRGRSLTEGGLKLGYKTPNNWEVAAFARNITNQIRSISAIDFNNLTGMINEPRIIGGEVKIVF
ncbi:TonB-dependent receptor [Sphingomonas sp. PR090111-T3T-6A]|uniref:TonB-dependent receptor n=1 Tax=Sphingomonas sp. PR090111-T3T-6A TaxID=685778 RepID=UPI00035E3247|nr:TonB-dependent receptor [Sphingomonas sp. PR090111-T3T-6A]